MSALGILREEIAKIGYSAIVNNYVFSDVFASHAVERTASVAAFTHTPPSYRNAAIAVIERGTRSSLDVVSDYRALGAPLLFVVEGDECVVWQVRSEDGPRQIARARAEELAALFFTYQAAWSPLAIQRAKSIGQFNPHYQLDFVDLGLLPAIEGEIHGKLDYLLNESLALAIDPATHKPRGIGTRALFLAVFRFLAAKVLQDRAHPLASAWQSEKIETILDTISMHYNLPALTVQPGSAEYRILTSVWERLRAGINFQNISADDLAFVYENTLVTPEIRRALGTHSTPRQIAEYIVCHLGFHEYAETPEQLRIYEPFAGSAVLLTSALRHLRELLPIQWTDQQRHEFLIGQMAGDEIDAFACEVATLSLILADYPSHNGWHIRERDLFQPGILSAQMKAHSVILCNPPFEAFSQQDRESYPIAQLTHSKPVAVLNAALDAHPLALGFVLPRTFTQERQFTEQRRRIEKLYGFVELVEVPDRAFKASSVESALLIAREPRPPAPSLMKIRSTEIADRDCQKFLKSGEVTTSRSITRRIVEDEPTGDLWIPALSTLWAYLQEYPKLDEKLRPAWGLQWTYHQANTWSEQRKEGYRKGLHNADQISQFAAARPVWVDYRERYVRRGYGQEWDKPKLIMNAARLSRGFWRLAAVADFSGLVYSQQFYGLWPRSAMSKRDILAWCAVVNGPVANAFIAAYSPSNRFRAAAVKQIPVPVFLPEDLGDLVSEYQETLNGQKLFEDERLTELLHRIDATVLKAYDLPPRLERELLDSFKHQERPVAHSWRHWLPDKFQPFIPLHEFVSAAYQKATRPWIQDVFRTLPPDEADALLKYTD